MTHTPEPWVLKERPDGWGNCTLIVGGNDKTVFFALYPTNLEDWNRIVACVNAMAGITDPQAFRDSVDKLTAYTKEAAEMIRQRDERIRELEGQIDEMLEQD